MKNLLILSLVIILLNSCNKRPGPEFRNRTLVEELISIPLFNIPKEDEIADPFFTNVRYIKPEATEVSHIGEYEKIIVRNDKIFILDKSNSQQAIFAFDMEGKFLFKIDKRGKGPGEYQDISDFYVDIENQYIGILHHSNVLKYGFDGKYLGNIELRKYFVDQVHFHNGRITAYCLADCGMQRCYVIRSFDTEGNLLFEDYPEELAINRLPMRKTNYITGGIDYSYVNLLYSDTVYRVGENNLLPKYKLDFGKYTLPRKVFENLFLNGRDPSYFHLNNLEYVLLGPNSFGLTKDYLHLFYTIKDNGYNAFFSLKSKKVKIIKGFSFEEGYIGEKFSPFDEKSFYSVIDQYSALLYKHSEEKKGAVLDPQKRITYNTARLNLYDNFLKDYTDMDNPIISVFDLKEF